VEDSESVLRETGRFSMKTKLMIDVEACPEHVRKAMEGATRAVVLGGGYDLGDGLERTLAEIVDASEKAGKILVIVDSIPKDLPYFDHSTAMYGCEHKAK
jgi:hypothetical protein